METNRPYDAPPADLMKKAGFTMGYVVKKVIDVSGDWGHGWIVDGRFVGRQSPCLTCGYEIYCQNVDDRCSENTFDKWTPKPTPGEFSREIMDNGTIRVLADEVDAKWHDMPEQPGDTM